MSDFQFDQETTASPASKRDGSAQRAQMHQFEGHLSSQWNIGDNPNGGYLLAIALRALLDAVPHPDPLSVTTQYLRPGLGGVAFELEIEVLRTGRSVSNARATLLQEGKPRVLVSAVCGDLSTGTGLTQTWSIPAPVIPAPDECVQRSAAGQGVELPILGRLDTRLEPSCAVPGSSEHAELNGWIRFKDGRNPDTTALPMFCDAFPPSPFAEHG